MSTQHNQQGHEEEALEREMTPDENSENENSEKAVEEQTVNALEQEIQELRDKYLRLFAEFDNFKKRSLKEKIEMSKTAGQEVIQTLLPVLDDFDRARKVALNPENQDSFSEGVDLVYNKLYSTLQQHGLKEMEIEDGEFDPELHDAITDIEVDDPRLKGKIVDVIEKGYFLNDRIIRHAKVIVGKK